MVCTRWPSRYGKGIKGDLAESAKWYLRAAERGMAPSQYNLGFLHLMMAQSDTNAATITIRIDSPRAVQETAKALKWIQRAAYSGFAHAVHLLETFPLQVPGMRVGVDGLTSPAGQVRTRHIKIALSG